MLANLLYLLCSDRGLNSILTAKKPEPILLTDASNFIIIIFICQPPCVPFLSLIAKANLRFIVDIFSCCGKMPVGKMRSRSVRTPLIIRG